MCVFVDVEEVVVEEVADGVVGVSDLLVAGGIVEEELGVKGDIGVAFTVFFDAVENERLEIVGLVGEKVVDGILINIEVEESVGAVIAFVVDFTGSDFAGVWSPEDFDEAVAVVEVLADGIDLETIAVVGNAAEFVVLAGCEIES